MLQNVERWCEKILANSVNLKWFSKNPSKFTLENFVEELITALATANACTSLPCSCMHMIIPTDGHGLPKSCVNI